MISFSSFLLFFKSVICTALVTIGGVSILCPVLSSFNSSEVSGNPVSGNRAFTKKYYIRTVDSDGSSEEDKVSNVNLIFSESADGESRITRES